MMPDFRVDRFKNIGRSSVKSMVVENARRTSDLIGGRSLISKSELGKLKELK